MFTENAHSLAMIAHSMKVIKAAVQHLNPLQTPVITLDHSLYALAKQIQWTLPEFDEHKFSAMMGGLHIEMASLQMKESGLLVADGQRSCTVRGSQLKGLQNCF